MKTLHVKVDNYLRFDDSLLGDAERSMLQQASVAIDPDDPTNQINLARRDNEGLLCLSRGFALKLRKGLARYGWQVVWEDHRVSVPIEDPISSITAITPFDYQDRAILRMLSVQQGIYEAPTAAGKTIACGCFISEARERTLVIVAQIGLATQWQERLAELGIKATIVGDNAWEESDVTIALRQTLWSRHEQLDHMQWWSTWGCVIVDECHAVSAETVRELLQRFPAKYRIGVSATPDRHAWLLHASRCILGEIFCRTTEKELEDAGRLVRPEVYVIKTPFEFDWKSSLDGKRQWQQMVKKLKTDPGRNEVIGEIIDSFHGHTAVVQTDHTSHATEIQAIALARGWAFDNVLELTGRQGREERDVIRHRAEQGNVLIVSTIAKEAFDVPRMDRYLLAWPTKSQTTTKQTLGRLKRVHGTKVDPPRYYDLLDYLVGPLSRQFHPRRAVYETQRLKLSIGTLDQFRASLRDPSPALSPALSPAQAMAACQASRTATPAAG